MTGERDADALERAAARAAHDAAMHAALLRVAAAVPAPPESFVERIARVSDAARTLAAEPDGWEPRLRLIDAIEEAATAIRAAYRRVAALRAEVAARGRELVERANDRAAILRRPRDARPSAQDLRRDEDARCELAALVGLRTRARSIALVARGGEDLALATGSIREIGMAPTREGAEDLALQLDGDDLRRLLRVRPESGAVAATFAIRDALQRWASALDEVACALRDSLNEAHGHPQSRDFDDRRGADLLCGRGAADLAVCVGGPRAVAARRADDAAGNAAAIAAIGDRKTAAGSLAVALERVAALSEAAAEQRRAAEEHATVHPRISHAEPAAVRRRTTSRCSS